MEELKCCPFCGGEAHVHEYLLKGLPSMFGIECDDCGSMTKPYYAYMSEAIAAWNRRTQNIGKKECCEQDGRCTFDE